MAPLRRLKWETESKISSNSHQNLTDFSSLSHRVFILAMYPLPMQLSRNTSMTVNGDALQSWLEGPSSREVCHVIRTGFRNDQRNAQIVAEGILSDSRITIKSAGSIGLLGDIP